MIATPASLRQFAAEEREFGSREIADTLDRVAVQRERRIAASAGTLNPLAREDICHPDRLEEEPTRTNPPEGDKSS